MMRQFVIPILLACTLPQPTAAQAIQGSVAPGTDTDDLDWGDLDWDDSNMPVAPAPPLPLQVLKPTQRTAPYDKVIYVLDISCSMSSKLGDAIEATRVFGSDGFRAGVVTFTDGFARWKGVPSHAHEKKEEKCNKRCVPDYWVELPRHHKEMMAYLKSISANGGTDPSAAIKHAIMSAPPDTLVVFISDGKFPHEDYEPDEDASPGEVFRPGPLTALKAALAWRKKQKLPPVQMLVWGTTSMVKKKESLIALAKLGGLGLWTADTKLTGPW